MLKQFLLQLIVIPNIFKPVVSKIIFCPVLLGCRTDGECPIQTACINGECINPCLLDPCGKFADCRVVDTLPVKMIACECIPGYQGDASEICNPGMRNYIVKLSHTICFLFLLL